MESRMVKLQVSMPVQLSILFVANVHATPDRSLSGRKFLQDKINDRPPKLSSGDVLWLNPPEVFETFRNEPSRLGLLSASEAVWYQ
jgi:hypothetical protein